MVEDGFNLKISNIIHNKYRLSFYRSNTYIRFQKRDMKNIMQSCQRNRKRNFICHRAIFVKNN
jgi:hypothetical protein